MKGKKKQLKQLKAVRMDLYQIKASNWDRKSSSSIFPGSLEAADTSPSTFPWEMTKEDCQFCFPLGLLRGVPGIMQGIWLMAQTPHPRKRREMVHMDQRGLAIGTVFTILPRLNFILYLAKAVVGASWIYSSCHSPPEWLMSLLTDHKSLWLHSRVKTQEKFSSTIACSTDLLSKSG